MRKVGHNVLYVVLFVLLTVSAVAGFWFGVVPQRWSPFSPISLDARPGWFVDPRLSVLRYDPALCEAVLKAPHIEAVPIADKPIRDGCGWTNSVRMSSAGGVTISADSLTCEMAAALALWIEYEVQPAAQKIFKQRVTRIAEMGTYDCRNIIGNPFWKNVRSQHATSNAIDIAAFTLADGRQVSVLRDWDGKGPEADFLHEVHARSCRYFRVSLGPNFNVAHKNHFHFDRGLLWTCR
jgi:hypothetical protein